MNVKRFVSKLQDVVQNNYTSLTISQKATQLSIEEDLRAIRKELQQTIGESPILHGYSVYSQNEEDGILQNIFDRIGVSKPSFFEFGVMPQENNSNYWLLQGSKGCWIDKSLSDFKTLVPDSQTLRIFDDFVKLDNIVSIVRKGCEFLDIPPSGIDLLSLDLDGNDYYFIERILAEGIRPKVFCLEYNAVFRPPLDVKIKYAENHQWQHDDYFGCSLAAYNNLLSPWYSLVSCNIPGSNCFFVLNEYSTAFTKYPLAALYQPPRYYHSPFTKGHPPSSKFILDHLKQ
jgi:hypothetical protein